MMPLEKAIFFEDVMPKLTAQLEKKAKVSESLIKHNCKIKKYPDGSLNITYCKIPIFREKGTEKPREDDVIEECWLKDKKKEKGTRDRSDELIRRHRDRVRDIIFMNDDFKYFLTITIDKEKLDRYDKDAIKKKLHNWLNNNVKRKGLKYVLIPEYHEDGALHAHALVNDVFTLVDSGKKDKEGRKVYNVPEWKYGFTTCVELDDNKIRVGNYVMKYITKGSDKIFGKYYWSSKNIQREPEIILCDEEFDKVSGEIYQPLKFNDNLQFKYDCTCALGHEITVLPNTPAPLIFVSSRGERIECKDSAELIRLMNEDIKEGDEYNGV